MHSINYVNRRAFYKGLRLLRIGNKVYCGSQLHFGTLGTRRHLKSKEIFWFHKFKYIVGQDVVHMSV